MKKIFKKSLKRLDKQIYIVYNIDRTYQQSNPIKGDEKEGRNYGTFKILQFEPVRQVRES